MSHVVLPLTCEAGSVNPSHRALTLTLACFKHAFISSFIEIAAIRSWKAICVFQSSKPAKSAVLEITTELISVFEIANPKIDQFTISKTTWYVFMFRLFIFYFVFDCLNLIIFTLEDITNSVFIFYKAVSCIFDKHSS